MATVHLQQHVRLPLPKRRTAMRPSTPASLLTGASSRGAWTAGSPLAAQRQHHRRQQRRLPLGLAPQASSASPLASGPHRLPHQPASSSPISTAFLPPPQQQLRRPVGLPPLPARGSSLTPNRRHVAARSYGPQYDSLVNLGSDFLTFLIATVLVVPVFKSAKQSPVLGYLFAGLVLGQLGLFRNMEEIEKLSELGVLFLLFEMGLELSIDRLRALANYAFGMGTLQMVLCTLAFTVLGLPPGESLFSQFLENVLHVPPSLAELRTVDEAVVIGAALSLSSSAFVLQLLRERGELDKRFGQATLGILLLQDIATVPFLVLLPLIEGNNAALLEGQDTMLLLQSLGPAVLKTLGGLGIVLLGGRLFMRRVFELVAEAKSEETFVALCLLTVTGASLLTQRMGFSDTLGAFVAGVLLSETNFKTQVEADIQPFRGILLGLFFVTTGSSLDVGLLLQQWPLALTLLAGLLGLKIGIITALGPRFGLTPQESVRTGFVLSQGGEFAFVLLALANQLNVLPAELNRLLIIVVVLSMALTPLLTEVGKRVADYMSAQDGEAMYSEEGYNLEEPVLICSFGDVGQTVANMLESPTLGRSVPYVAFDQTVSRVQAAQEAGFNVLYGDGSSKKVLHAAGIDRPKAVVVSYTARQRAVTAVETLRETFHDVPIYARALDMRHAAALHEAGADHIVTAASEAGLTLGSQLVRGLGVPPRAAASLADVLRIEMDARSLELSEELSKPSSGAGSKNGRAAAPPSFTVFKFDQSKAPAATDDTITSDSVVAAGTTVIAAAAAADSSAGQLPRSSLLSVVIQKLGSVQANGSTDLDNPDSPATPSIRNGSQGEAGSGSSGNGISAADVEDAYDVVSVLSSVDSEDEGSSCPDGSEECPVAWDAMKSGETSAGSGDKGGKPAGKAPPQAADSVEAAAAAAAATGSGSSGSS